MTSATRPVAVKTTVIIIYNIYFLPDEIKLLNAPVTPVLWKWKRHPTEMKLSSLIANDCLIPVVNLSHKASV